SQAETEANRLGVQQRPQSQRCENSGTGGGDDLQGGQTLRQQEINAGEQRGQRAEGSCQVHDREQSPLLHDAQNEETVCWRESAALMAAARGPEFRPGRVGPPSSGPTNSGLAVLLVLS